MAVKLRLRRMGKKKRPFYRIVVTDSRAPRDGRFIELVGTYDPLIKPYKVDLEENRIIHWLENGAQPTQTVKSLFKRKGLWLKWDLKKHGADEAKISEEFAKWELLQAEREKRQAQKEVEKVKEKAKAEEEEASAEEEQVKEAEAVEEAPEAEQEETVEAAETPAEQPAEEKAEEAETSEEKEKE